LQHDDPPVALRLDFSLYNTGGRNFGDRRLGEQASDGRIHGDFWQIGTTCRRMICREPNLLQVPRDGAYREAIRPGPRGRTGPRCGSGGGWYFLARYAAIFSGALVGMGRVSHQLSVPYRTP
jgi:hypothetical protein